MFGKCLKISVVVVVVVATNFLSIVQGFQGLLWKECMF
jgi:hypothetical protein